jgi:hypothetical protein
MSNALGFNDWRKLSIFCSTEANEMFHEAGACGFTPTV